MIDHLGIAVRDHAESKAFYLAALAPLGIGVQMNVSKEESGAPSDYYHPNYYGAFVIDPNGVNLEAVCHAP